MLIKMPNSNRDILVLFKQELMSPKAMEHEVGLLHDLLFRVERLDNIVISHEILDLNRHKLLNKPRHVKQFFKNIKEKPFVFLNNNN